MYLPPIKEPELLSSSQSSSQHLATLSLKCVSVGMEDALVHSWHTKHWQVFGSDLT